MLSIRAGCPKSRFHVILKPEAHVQKAPDKGTEIPSSPLPKLTDLHSIPPAPAAEIIKMLRDSCVRIRPAEIPTLLLLMSECECCSLAHCYIVITFQHKQHYFFLFIYFCP